MKKNFKFMLVALFALIGVCNASAEAIVGKTQETANGLLYKVLSVYKTPNGTTKVNTVSVAQTNWETKAADNTTLTIPSTVTFNVKGDDTDGTAIDQEVEFTVVTVAADGFKDLDCIETVSLPATITTIEAGAFSGTSISELDLSTTTITTLNILFEDDNVKLAKVKLPATLTTMAESALANCIQLAEVDFSLCTKLATINNYALGNTIISSLDFSNCEKLTNLSAVTPFVTTAVTDNSNLTTIVLPEELAGSVGTAFANLKALTSINLEETAVTTIPDGAFANDAALPALATGAKVESIAGSPFGGCESLASLTINAAKLATLGTASTELFGTTEDVLETLKITGNVDGLTIAAGILTNQANLATIEIAKGAEIKSGSTLTAGAITGIAEGAAITLGKLSVAPGKDFIEIGDGTAEGTLTIESVNVALSDEIVKGKTATTVGAIGAFAVALDAFGETATSLNFTGEIKQALTKYTAENTELTEINFNSIVMPVNTLPTNFNNADITNALTVTWTPADNKAVKAFAQDAFKSSTEATEANRKVTLVTTTAVATLYGFDESNLYNVIFSAAAVASEAIVYGNASATYFYGKFQAPAGANYEIAKTNADGDQVVVYSAFVDAADNKIYMDPLAIDNGRYIVAAGEAVIVRVKNPTTTEAMTKPAGGLNSKVAATTTDDGATMRYDGSGNIVNDLEVAATVISSDDMALNYPGKTFYAMKNPASVGALDWGLVGTTSYVPAGALYVLTDGVAAGRLQIVWLDGSEDTTAIINKINNREIANDGVIYNLQGVRVSGTQKGIYIKNGKKFIVK